MTAKSLRRIPTILAFLLAAISQEPVHASAPDTGVPGDYFGPAVAPSFPIAEQQPCRDSNPQRSAFFGATHIHTTLSGDANAFGVTAGPNKAYAFTRGAAIALPPFDEQGKASRVQQLTRPLDFAAVADHAEYLGEVVRCTTPGNQGYNSKTCQGFRGEDLGGWPEDLAHLARLFSIVLKGKAEPGTVTTAILPLP